MFIYPIFPPPPPLHLGVRAWEHRSGLHICTACQVTLSLPQWCYSQLSSSQWGWHGYHAQQLICGYCISTAASGAMSTNHFNWFFLFLLFFYLSQSTFEVLLILYVCQVQSKPCPVKIVYHGQLWDHVVFVFIYVFSHMLPSSRACLFLLFTQ